MAEDFGNKIGLLKPDDNGNLVGFAFPPWNCPMKLVPNKNPNWPWAVTMHRPSQPRSQSGGRGYAPQGQPPPQPPATPPARSWQPPAPPADAPPAASPSDAPPSDYPS